PAVARLSAAPQAATASAPAARPAGLSPARAALEAARNGGKLPPMASAVPKVVSAPPPWEDEPPPATGQAVSETAAAVAQKKTESSASVVALNDADVAVAPERPVQAPQQRMPARAPAPVPELNWDGNWPALAAALPLRGVVQQLAQQSELLKCEVQGEGAQFLLRIPLETLRSAGSVEKLTAALTEHFGRPVRVETEIGAVEHTANAVAVAEREARQRQAEEDMQRDPFVLALMREFGATIVPGSIRPV
ncbi:DNA polymerase III subunit gamma/tau C-terminal domain-containing protein, partial [Ralstonia sp. RL]|uniref:DNA polymerase III subunit gamma/tau C-terminal domain-containing protein n=1 Tax=Ralstonia sp. RL TaxID=1839756 RepID=UPI000A63AABE